MQWYNKINFGGNAEIYKGHIREPENVPFMNSCPLYTG